MFAALISDDQPAPRWVDAITPYVDWAFMGVALVAASFAGIVLGTWLSGLL